MNSPALPRYSFGEEIANSITHGAGALLSVAGLALMTAFAALDGNAWHVVACSVFGSALILCYATSTLYHSIRNERIKRVLWALDHSAIFLLIAGTYTPFTLVSLHGPWGWSLFGAIWGLAVAGILLRLVLRGRLHGLLVGIYVAMGWAVLIAAKPLIEHLAWSGIALLAAGGIAYTGGVFFYRWERLPYHHAIWHGFVLLGSTLHLLAVLFYVIP